MTLFQTFPICVLKIWQIRTFVLERIFLPVFLSVSPFGFIDNRKRFRSKIYHPASGSSKSLEALTSKSKPY